MKLIKKIALAGALVFAANAAMAADKIVFTNKTELNFTAVVNGYPDPKPIPANGKKMVTYEEVSILCIQSASCRAEFRTNGKSIGFATINAGKGKYNLVAQDCTDSETGAITKTIAPCVQDKSYEVTLNPEAMKGGQLTSVTFTKK